MSQLKKYSLTGINLLIIIWSLSSPISVGIDTIDFTIGEVYQFGSQITSSYNVAIDHNHEQNFFQTQIKNTLIYIDYLNLQSGQLNYTMWYQFSHYYEGKYHYSKNINTTITNTPLVQPFWTKRDSNETILGGLTLNWFFYFLEPDWQTINENMKKSILNSSYIIYSDRRHNLSITVKEFLSLCKAFSFMGESTLQQATEILSSDTHRWWGSFKIDEGMYYWNMSEPLDTRKYYSYTMYEWSFLVEFTVGGTLKFATYSETYSRGNVIGKKSFVIQNNPINLNTTMGISPRASSGFEFLLCIIILSIINRTSFHRRFRNNGGR